jgi:hypothetical protein
LLLAELGVIAIAIVPAPGHDDALERAPAPAADRPSVQA